LVPEDLQTKRLRDGKESVHYSYEAAINASRLLRLLKRFETIDNDRKEHLIDVVSDLYNTEEESRSLLKNVVEEVGMKGTVGTLLRQLCESLDDHAKLQSVHLTNLLLEVKDLRKDFGQLETKTSQVKEELTQLRHEVMNIKDEIQSLKEAMIYVLPNKLRDAMSPVMQPIGSIIDFSIIESSK